MEGLAGRCPSGGKKEEKRGWELDRPRGVLTYGQLLLLLLLCLLLPLLLLRSFSAAVSVYRRYLGSVYLDEKFGQNFITEDNKNFRFFEIPKVILGVGKKKKKFIYLVWSV